MVKRLKVSAYVAALAVLGLLSVGCSLGGNLLGYGTGLANVPRILTAILREDLLS
jgi:hypothetical protein